MMALVRSSGTRGPLIQSFVLGLIISLFQLVSSKKNDRRMIEDGTSPCSQIGLVKNQFHY